MAETEDCKVSEVATTDEKCESGMSSYQDPSRPDFSGSSHTNPVNDLENSYVEANGTNDDVVFDRNVFAESSCVLPELITMVDDQGMNSQNEKLDVADLLMFGQIPSLISHKTMKHVSSLEDENKFQIPFANSLEIDDFNDNDASRIVLETEDVNNEDESRIVLGTDDINNDDESMIVLETEDDNNNDEPRIVLEIEDVNNDGESRIVLAMQDVEEMGGQFVTVTQCCTENDRTGNDNVVLNKNVVAESSSVSPESIVMADDQGLELNSKNEILDVVDDDVVLNKNVVAGSSSVPDSITMVNDRGLELNSKNGKLDDVDGEVSKPLNEEEKRRMMGIDLLEEFPSLMSHNRREIISDVSAMPGTKICSFDVKNDDELKTENVQTGNYERKDISVASSKACSTETARKPFNFLIKIPRADDEVLREQIRLAKLHLDEKMKLRDVIQVQIQEKRLANHQIHGLHYESAKVEVRSARKLVKSKHMEIDYLLSVINKAKTASSIENINSQIRDIDYKMQRRTFTLKEEKHLIREIKQLKQIREELSSNMGNQDEIKQASSLEQREEAEERLKILWKDFGILKHEVFKAEATVAEAKKKYDDENQMVRILQAQFRAADKVQQKAYAQWQNLKKELLKKGKHYFKYKNDAAVATNHALNRDTEALNLLCTNQVEIFMQLWNTNEEYRREYARFNARSTVRRFGTQDGRTLGPGEKLPVLPDERVNTMASTPVKVDLASSRNPNPEIHQETTNENATLDGESANKVTEPKNITKGTINEVHEEPITSKDEVNSVRKEDTTDENATLGGTSTKNSDTVSVGDLTNEVPIKSKNEVESIRKEEPGTMEEAEAKLKEQRRLEDMAKDNEALKRKKLQAEKLQMREELKTQKEAEEREKKREKRRRKKERKAAALKDSNDSNNCEKAPVCESSKDTEVKETPSVGPKKPKKPWLYGKQSEKMSVRLRLRNQNKKKLQQWMWVGITGCIILLLFLLGNIGEYSNVALKCGGMFTNLLCLLAL